MTYKRYRKYIEVVREIEEIPINKRDEFANELARRHGMWWTMPSSTYKRCKHLLHYKESLGRNSPYYADLLKITNKDDLKVVLIDLYTTIRIRFNMER